jgi:hypothetical protein
MTEELDVLRIISERLRAADVLFMLMLRNAKDLKGQTDVSLVRVPSL